MNKEAKHVAHLQPDVLLREMNIATLFAFFHLALLKYPGWLKWLNLERDQKLALPDLPPASLLGALFIGFVAVTRLAEIFGSKIARKIFEVGFIVLILAITALFFLGSGL